MNRFLKLVHYEFMRFRFIYLSLLILTLLSQFIGLFVFAKSSLSRIHTLMREDLLTEAEYLLRYGVVSFIRYTESLWFMAPIVLCIAALLLYVFMIWYRDWLGKNMFIYRLMMLPTSRITIYASKLSVIVLAVLGLIAVQLLVLPMQLRLFDMWIPEVFRSTVSMTIFDVISSHEILLILIPQTFTDFVIYYGGGITGVIIVFTAILMERSYRWKGLVAGIVYSAVACGVIFLPVILVESFQWNLYFIELMVLELFAAALTVFISLWLSYYLLKNKVSV